MTWSEYNVEKKNCHQECEQLILGYGMINLANEMSLYSDHAYCTTVHCYRSGLMCKKSKMGHINPVFIAYLITFTISFDIFVRISCIVTP